MRWILQALTLSCLLSALLVSCDQPIPKLKIERTDRRVKTEAPPENSDHSNQWEKTKNGLYFAQFHVPRSFLGYSPPSENSTDPFVTSHENSEDTAQQRLESFGISFGKNTTAMYAPEMAILYVVQTKEQMELIHLLINSDFHDVGKEAYVRAEVYELPTSQILQLIENADGKSDHTAERNAALKAVRQGRGKIVALPSISCHAGQRAKSDGASQIICSTYGRK